MMKRFEIANDVLSGRWGWCGFAIAALLMGGVCIAQPKPAETTKPPAKPAGAAAVAAPTAVDTGEEKLMSHLASREMDTLLAYYFEKNKITPEKQQAIKGIVALRQLKDKSIPASRRRVMLKDALKGVGNFLKNSRDTEAMMNLAGTFIEGGVDSLVSQIEYFGETPARQAELNESADAVIKILDRAIEECLAQQDAVLAGQVRPSQQLLAKWQVLEERLQTAKWVKAFCAYSQGISMDAADPNRKVIAEAAVVFLKDFESPEAQREAIVKIQMGKLLMLKGDHAEAVKKLEEARKIKDVEKGQLYETYFYPALSMLMAKNEAQAVKRLDELQKWVAANVQGEDLKSIGSGVGLLEYRINEFRGELAKDDAKKKEFMEAGEKALTRVMKENPAMEPVIKRMLLDKLPADADVTKLDTILLRSLLARGVDEFIRAKEGESDARGKPVIERAIAAARQIQTRKGQPAVNEDVEDEAAFLIGMLYSKVGKPAEAVEESLNYLKVHKTNKERTTLALNNALAGVTTLRKDASQTSQRVNDLIDGTWKLAIAGGRREYSYVYGKRLFDRKEYAQAVSAFKQIPEDHPMIAFAKFFQLTAMQEMLDDKTIDANARKTLVQDIQKLAVEVDQKIDAELAKAKDDMKPRLKFYKTSSILLAAQLKERELKDYAGVIAMLTGFEDSIKGTDPKLEAAQMGTALRLRINALMASGKTQDAVEEVKKLVAAGDQRTQTILFQLIQQMDEAFLAAYKAGDKEAMAKNSQAQVALVRPLIEQTKDEKVRDAYEEWEARLLVRAANASTEEAKKSEYLTTAQGVFTNLLGKNAEGSPKHDTMRYQLALISYLLKDYKKVYSEMGQLVSNGKLGAPDITEVGPDGTETFKENATYWEGLLRFMQATYELSKTDKSPAMNDSLNNTIDTIKALYRVRGKFVGGAMAREYMEFRQQILPGWDENQAAATKPTTQPAAK